MAAQSKSRSVQEDEQSITIRVSDNGCGMTKHELKKIFEPFFTTKGHAGGTGLGLSITYSLVQELGGSIGVESEPGKGNAVHDHTTVIRFGKGGVPR